MSESSVAVVTGSAVGIGRGICVALAERGMRIAALDIDGGNNRDTVAAVASVDGACLAVDCDVTSASEVRRAFNEIANAFGRVDVLVNNAALYVDTSLIGGAFDRQVDGFQRSIDICLMGSYYCALAAVPHLQRAGGGNIVNIITEHIKEGHLSTGGPATGYDCAKWSQWRLTETWAVELAPSTTYASTGSAWAPPTRRCCAQSRSPTPRRACGRRMSARRCSTCCRTVLMVRPGKVTCLVPAAHRVRKASSRSRRSRLDARLAGW